MKWSTNEPFEVRLSRKTNPKFKGNEKRPENTKNSSNGSRSILEKKNREMLGKSKERKSSETPERASNEEEAKGGILEDLMTEERLEKIKELECLLERLKDQKLQKKKIKEKSQNTSTEEKNEPQVDLKSQNLMEETEEQENKSISETSETQLIEKKVKNSTSEKEVNTKLLRNSRTNNHQRAGSKGKSDRSSISKESRQSKSSRKNSKQSQKTKSNSPKSKKNSNSSQEKKPKNKITEPPKKSKNQTGSNSKNEKCFEKKETPSIKIHTESPNPSSSFTSEIKNNPEDTGNKYSLTNEDHETKSDPNLSRPSEIIKNSNPNAFPGFEKKEDHLIDEQLNGFSKGTSDPEALEPSDNEPKEPSPTESPRFMGKSIRIGLNSLKKFRKNKAKLSQQQSEKIEERPSKNGWVEISFSKENNDNFFEETNKEGENEEKILKEWLGRGSFNE